MPDSIISSDKPKLVVDTNVLIDTPEILLDGEWYYLIPYTVLQELDGLKKNPDLSYAVRTAIKIIYEQYVAGNCQVTNIPTNYETNDEKIVKVAKTQKCRLLTQDIGAMVVAHARHVDILQEEEEIGLLDFTGYKEVEGKLDYESYHMNKEMQLGEFEYLFDVVLKPNEYLIINRVNGKIDIWKEQKGIAVKVFTTMKPYKDADIMVTPVDSYQMAAWDAVASDVPLTVLEGKVGSSKTLSALVGLLLRTRGQKKFEKYSKIYYSRAPIPVDRSLQLGFMPGTMDEKSSQWIAGISSNLKFLFGKEGGDKVLNECFEFVSLESIQGLSLMPDEALLIDEYQLLSRDMLKQVLSRVGQGGKVVLAGDPLGQTYGINRSREGFKVLKKYFGQTDFMNYIQLNNVYRSDFVEFVEQMFK